MPRMSMERMPEGPPAGAPIPGDEAAAARALRIQILATGYRSQAMAHLYPESRTSK